MFELSHLHPSGSRPYEIVELGMIVHVTHAGDSNKGYMNDYVRATMKANRGKVSGKTPEILREADRIAFPKHGIIQGWEPLGEGYSALRRADGSIIPFSKENCLELLKAIPPYLFDPLRNWCSEASNFVDESFMVSDEEVEEIAGN